MFDLLKAEFSYFWVQLLIMTIIIDTIPGLEKVLDTGFDTDKTGGVILLMSAFMYVLSRSQEGRDRMHALTTASFAETGAARISILLISILWLTANYITALFFSGLPVTGYSTSGMMMSGIAMIIVAGFLISEDISIEFSNRHESFLKTVGMILVAIVFIFMMLSLDESRSESINKFNDFINSYNPFAGEYGALRLFLTGLIMSGLSVISFKKRKSYVSSGNNLFYGLEQ